LTTSAPKIVADYSEALLGVDGLVGGAGLGDEDGDAGAVLNADDGGGVGVEWALEGILGGAGLAGAGAFGRETFGRNWHSGEI
jgi:hypothetical protein